MQDLQDLEKFEIEVLNLFNNSKILESLYFGGGTMLRLCHNLSRFSTDLDFWMTSATDVKDLFSKLKKILSENYQLTDFENKRSTLLFEFKSPLINRRLKIEIRKEAENFEWERKIAFSKFTNLQVQVKGLTLEQMMKNKFAAFLSRKIIRDCFDIQFIFMRGISLPDDKAILNEALIIIESFKEKDYKITLGSILDSKERKFYIANDFKILKEEIRSKLL